MTTPGAPDPAPRPPRLLESVDHTRSSLLDAVRTGIIAYAGVWVVTFFITGTTLLAAAIEDDVPWSWYLTSPGQAVAMSSHGTFEQSTTSNIEDDYADIDEGSAEGFDSSEDDEGFGSADEDEDTCCTDEEDLGDDQPEELPPAEVDESIEGGSFTSSSRFATVSLTVIALMVGVLWAANRRAERRRPTRSRRAVLAASAVTGMTFAALTWAVAFAARLRIDGDDGHAGSLSILFYGSVLGTVVGVLSRRPLARRRIATRLPAELAASLRAVAVYLAAFVVLLVPAAAIYATAHGEPEAILTFPLAILNVAVYALTLGQLAGFELQGVPFGNEVGLDFVWLFSDDFDRVLLALIPLSIAALGLGSAVLARRSTGRPRTAVDSFWLIATFAAAGALLTAVSAVTTSTSMFGSGIGLDGNGGIFTISLAPVPWLFLVMAAWGVVTETATRTIGPRLAALVPERMMVRLAGS